MLTRSNLSFCHIMENDNELFQVFHGADLIIYFDENWNHRKSAKGIFGEMFE